jgi:predicted DNA binding protein
MTNLNLTELEKATLKNALHEGYIYDGTYDENAKYHFLCWGFEGKQERGAAASLVKKGIIDVDYIDGETYVYLLISREEAEKISGAKSLA